ASVNTSAIATTPNETACVIDGSITTYQISVVAATTSTEVIRAIEGPNSRRSRRCNTIRPADIATNDDSMIASTYARPSPRRAPTSGRGRPRIPPIQSAEATARYAGAQTIA